jgi:hypothetical protein
MPSKVALLFSNRYVSIDLDRSVVRYVRNGVPFPSTEQLVESTGDVARVLDRLGRARYALLVDLRQAGGVADYAMANERKRLLFGFARTAIVVKSAVSAREVRRHADEDEIDVRVFIDDERAALAYAQSGGPVSDAFSSGIIEASPRSNAITTPGTGRRRTRG